MKTSSIIIIGSFIAGISIISFLVIQNPPKNSVGDDIFGFNQKSYVQQYWEDFAETYPDFIITNETRQIEERPFVSGDPRIEINGLKIEYSKDEPINFEVLVIGNGSGCANTWFSIFTEVAGPSPIYSQGFVSICDDVNLKYLAIPMSFSINTEHSPIPKLESGKYVVSVTYYQDRGSFGDIKQEFIIK